MSIEAVARATLRYFPPDLAIVMVAIAGAESGYRLDARGDHLSIFDPWTQVRIRPYSCGGYTSFGPYQVHLPAHYPRLRELTGSSDPCVWAAWLFDPDNSARIAREIYDRQGFSAWTAYNTGAYIPFQDEAAYVVFALATARREPPTLAVEPPPIPVSPAALPPIAPPGA